MLLDSHKNPIFLHLKGRLKIYGLDFRHIPSILEFTQFLSNSLPRLDILINNAAQTIRRPTIYYNQVVSNELSMPIENMNSNVKSLLGNDFPHEFGANTTVTWN